MGKVKIIWTNQAKLELKKIYNYYKVKSVQGANNVKSDLLQGPKTICFAKQYQVDEINPNYRRIIVRDYKIIYKEMKEQVFIMDIISTLQSPEVLKSK